MKNRKRLRNVALAIVLVLIVLFVVVGIPLIRDTFTPPITGLPTVVSTGSSLRDRYTQTAAAKQAVQVTATAAP